MTTPLRQRMLEELQRRNYSSNLKTAEVFNILQDDAWFDFPFAKDVNQRNLYLVRYEAYLMR